MTPTVYKTDSSQVLSSQLRRNDGASSERRSGERQGDQGLRARTSVSFLARSQDLGQVVVGSGDSFQVRVPHAPRVLNFASLHGGKVAND